jgi:SWI/SNF chromatin-remodeling complex subunit SWI1
MIEADFLLMQRDYWQSYVEKTIMGIYSLIFMAPYELKQKIKADKSLGIKTVLLRMAQRVLLLSNNNGRAFDKPLDKGTGLLGANKDVAWEMLMMREVFTNKVEFFNELDILVRVDCP